MSKLVDLKRYKLAKVFTNDLVDMLKDYEKTLKGLEVMQSSLAKWGKYKSPNLIAHKLEESKLFLHTEIFRLRAFLKKEKEIIDNGKSK